MRYGRLDRRVTIQRRSSAVTSSGQPVDTWSAIASRWASVSPVRGSEGFSVPQVVAKEQVEIGIRWTSATADIHPGDRLVFPAGATGQTAVYDVLAVHEVGRREGHKIIAERRPDALIPDTTSDVWGGSWGSTWGNAWGTLN